MPCVIRPSRRPLPPCCAISAAPGPTGSPPAWRRSARGRLRGRRRDVPGLRRRRGRAHPRPACRPRGGTGGAGSPAGRFGGQAPGRAGRGGGRDAGDGPLSFGSEDRAVPRAVCRTGGRVPAALGERPDGQGGLRAGLRQRMEARPLRQAARALRRLPQPGLPAGDRWGDRRAPARPPYRRRLSDAPGRDLPVPRRRLRQGDMAPRHRRLPGCLPVEGGAGGAGALALGQWRPCLDFLRRPRAWRGGWARTC